jgi:protein required for attachment to host cells
MNLVETVKGLQKDVQCYKDDNERLMRAKVQQDDFNFKLMQSLEIIENKIGKKIESSRSRSRRSHDEKRREETSVGKHSSKKACSSSCPSPIKNHKRRIGVDEL